MGLSFTNDSMHDQLTGYFDVGCYVTFIFADHKHVMFSLLVAQ
jgi:hypothetical protein